MRVLSIAIAFSLVACATEQPKKDVPLQYTDALAAQYKGGEEDAAKEMLADAAGAGSTCSKLSIYANILESYPNTKAAKFARRNYSRLESEALAVIKRTSKHFSKMNESELTSMMENTSQLKSSCPAGKISDACDKDLDTLAALRLKKYGY